MSSDTTLRDEIWAEALNLSQEKYRFKINHVMNRLGLKPNQRKTVQRTLKAMTELNWLRHPHGSHYYSGVYKAESNYE